MLAAGDEADAVVSRLYSRCSIEAVRSLASSICCTSCDAVIQLFTSIAYTSFRKALRCGSVVVLEIHSSIARLNAPGIFLLSVHDLLLHLVFMA